MKMPSCSVACCRNRSDKINFKSTGTTYHIFPKEEKYKKKWIEATGRSNDWLPTKNNTICSDHFKDICFQTSPKRRILCKDAVPTLKLRMVYAKNTNISSVSKSAYDEDEDDGEYIEDLHRVFRVVSDVPESLPDDSQQTDILLDLRSLHDLIVGAAPNVTGKPYALHVKCENSDKQEFVFTSSSKSRSPGEDHRTPCGECGANIRGRLYMCVTCPDHAICQICESLGLHGEHVVVRVSSTASEKARHQLRRCCEKLREENTEELISKNKGLRKKSSQESKIQGQSTELKPNSMTKIPTKTSIKTPKKEATKRKTNEGTSKKATQKRKKSDAGNATTARIKKDVDDKSNVKVKVEYFVNEDVEVSAEKADHDPLGVVIKSEAQTEESTRSSEGTSFHIFPAMRERMLVIEPLTVNHRATTRPPKAGNASSGTFTTYTHINRL